VGGAPEEEARGKDLDPWKDFLDLNVGVEFDFDTINSVWRNGISEGDFHQTKRVSLGHEH